MNEVDAPTRRRPVVAVAPEAKIAVVPEDDVLIDHFAAMTGTTRKAIEGKIARGVWVEGRQYHRAPDGVIWIDRKGVRKWVRGE